MIKNEKGLHNLWDIVKEKYIYALWESKRNGEREINRKLILRNDRKFP